MYVVVIRTAGNQGYIFSSGKRQEIVGASDLITRAEDAWLKAALDVVFPGFDREGWRIESHGAELLVAAAGQVTLLVREKAAGLRLVTEVTGRGVEDAPGLDVCGVVVECEPGSLASAIRQAQRELPFVRESRPGPRSRFLRLPIVEDCASSGLPATEVRHEVAGAEPKVQEERPRPLSSTSVAKLAAYQTALDRLARAANTDWVTMREIVDRLGLDAEWVAVVHADGNGMGEIFAGLPDLAGGEGLRPYADELRDFSAGVGRCALRAFREALRGIGDTPPVLPLVIGGDDLTVVCEGDAALPFTQRYLEAFEEATANDDLLRPVLSRAGRECLSAAAGVAIVKRNYPFHFAYDLAEDLTTDEAKQVKAWGSALAFTVLYESSAPDRARIREAVPLPGGFSGSATPYLVGRGSRDERARGRRWQDLERRVDALNRTDPVSKERLMPGGAAHDLREGLCLGTEVAASRVELLRRRFEGDQARSRALADLTEERGALVWTDHEERKVTGLLDAMAAQPFLKGGAR